MTLGDYSTEKIIKYCLNMLLFTHTLKILVCGLTFMLIINNFALAQSQTIKAGDDINENSRVIQFKIAGIKSPGYAARIDSVMKSKQGIISSYTDYVTRECTVVIDEKIQKNELLDIIDFLGIKTEEFQFNE